jgi:cytochrome P450
MAFEPAENTLHGQAMGEAMSRSATLSRRSKPRRIPTVHPWSRPGGSRASQGGQIGFLSAAVDAYGDIFRYRRLGFPLIMINHPEYIRRVLLENSGNYDKEALIFKVVRPVLRNGLISNPGGESWSRQRRLMQPSFRPASVATFAENMTTEALLMLERWGADPGPAGMVNISDDLGRMALRIVNRSLFSADVSASAQAFADAFLIANEVFATFFRFPFPPLGFPTPAHRRMRAAIDTMDRFVAAFIEQRLHGDGRHNDLLSMLMHAVDHEGDGARMDTGQLHDEVLNIVVGAYETTTNSLSWVFYLLAQHPREERKFLDEVDRVLDGRLPTFDDVHRLTYTRMVIEETLRLYSPAWQTMRRAREADVIGGYHVPANSNIYLNSYVLHRHVDFWTEPEKFDPDRFTPEQIAARPKHVYIPFGSGPRICIGKHFAMTEIALVMATIAQRYRLVLPPGAAPVEPLPLITLHPKDGVRLRLEPR